MITVFERTSTALSTLSPAIPFALAPYKSSGDLPDTFIAYQLITGAQEQSADDSETQRSYLMQVSTFSRSGLINLPNVDGVMLAAGFQKSNERQLPQDQQTGHYGLAQDYIYL